MKHTPTNQLLRALAHPQVTQCPRTFSTTRHIQSQPQPPQPSQPPTSPPPPQKTDRKSHLRTPELTHSRHKQGELQPRPLSKPLGIRKPPQPTDNAPQSQTLSERYTAYTSYDAHRARRKEIMSDIFERNYYRDIGNLGAIHRGKSILAPSTPFKREIALYFPNFFGRTLTKSSLLSRVSAENGGESDTTSVFRGRVTVVSLVNTTWAQNQVASFVSADKNPELHAYMRTKEASEANAQFATINVEPNFLKRWLVRLFFWRLRRERKEKEWSTYFLLSKSIEEDLRDALGVWNAKVGYVYLLDGSCKVRWAGNGDARDDERESLVRCVQRLCVEQTKASVKSVKREDARS